MTNDYYNSHLKRMNETLQMLKPYLNYIKTIINIGYSDFDLYIKNYFKNSDIFYLVPEYIENKNGDEYIKGDICSSNFKANKKI
ncbi:hypothetical protein [Acidiplasma aeolicum]|jgi:hypothetical protein|uniref:hypothetical protein n=1 Tax=Acidiplasma aeolicum TaxID=507754 RepID=UPI003724814E